MKKWVWFCTSIISLYLRVSTCYLARSNGSALHKNITFVFPRRLSPQYTWFIHRERRYPSNKNIQYRTYVKVSSIWSARVALYLAPRLAILSITSAARFTKISVSSCKYDRVSASAIYFESRQKADTSYEFDCDRIAVSPRLGEIFCSLKG